MVLASNVDKLNNLMDRIQQTNEEYGLQLNLAKTKWMLIIRNYQPGRQLLLKDHRTEHVAT